MVDGSEDLAGDPGRSLGYCLDGEGQCLRLAWLQGEVVVATDHPLAPFAATAAFASIGIGTAATHLLPGWGYFSEPLLFGSAADSWAAAAAVPEILAALWLTWLGLQTMRANNFQLVAVQTS